MKLTAPYPDLVCEETQRPERSIFPEILAEVLLDCIGVFFQSVDVFAVKLIDHALVCVAHEPDDPRLGNPHNLAICNEAVPESVRREAIDASGVAGLV